MTKNLDQTRQFDAILHLLLEICFKGTPGSNVMPVAKHCVSARKEKYQCKQTNICKTLGLPHTLFHP